MRGDMRSNHDGTIQRDSSSGSSSPHSNASHEEEMLANPNIFAQKPIYNFSIPDVIKHEPRVEHHEERRNENRSIGMSRRKRAHPSRSLLRDYACNYDNETPIFVRNKKRRRAAAAAAADDSDDCHRAPVTQVIDLTEDDYQQSSHSDSEVVDSSHAETRPLHHNDSSNPFGDDLSNFERFQQHLQASRERVQHMHSSTINRCHRLRRCRLSRSIITDSPLVTDDMLDRSPEPVNVSTPELTTSDDSVMVINEVRRDQTSSDDDHTIALRMANDPTFSPPYHVSPSVSRHHHHARNHHLDGDVQYANFQERIRAIRRSRERREHARRTSQQAREHITRFSNDLNLLRQCVHRSAASNNTNNTNEENNRSTDNTTGADSSLNNTDVEFIREFHPRSQDYLLPSLDGIPPLTASFRTSDFSNYRRHLPFPDFRMSSLNLLSGPNMPPRLHHLHHLQEDYEALWNLAERIGPAKPRGLSKTELDRIPSFRFSTVTAKETNDKCVVCMGEYANREKLRRLPCTHDFHSKCIDKWLRSNKTCPVCRDEVNPVEETV